MISHLPLLFADGHPTCLDKITIGQLEKFIPFMIHCSTGERDNQKLTVPKWWPKDLEFSLPLVMPSGMESKWMDILKNLVFQCYTHHGCEFMLQFCTDLCKRSKSELKFVDCWDGTTSLYNKVTGKLLVTFRNENLFYDRKKESPRKTLLPRSNGDSVQPQIMVQPPLFDIYLCDSCEGEFNTLKEVQEHEKSCCAKKQYSSPSQVLAEKLNTDQERFLNYFNLASVQRVKEKAEPSVDRPQYKRLVGNTLRYTGIPLTSPLGIFINKRSRASHVVPSVQLDRMERYCSTKPSSGTARSREQRPITWPVSWKPRKKLEGEDDWVHIYKPPMRQWRKKTPVVRHTVNRKMQNLLAQCRKLQVRLKRLTSSEIEFHTSRARSVNEAESTVVVRSAGDHQVLNSFPDSDFQDYFKKLSKTNDDSVLETCAGVSLPVMKKYSENSNMPGCSHSSYHNMDEILLKSSPLASQVSRNECSITSETYSFSKTKNVQKMPPMQGPYKVFSSLPDENIWDHSKKFVHGIHEVSEPRQNTEVSLPKQRGSDGAENSWESRCTNNIFRNEELNSALFKSQDPKAGYNSCRESHPLSKQEYINQTSLKQGQLKVLSSHCDKNDQSFHQKSVHKARISKESESRKQCVDVSLSIKTLPPRSVENSGCLKAFCHSNTEKEEVDLIPLASKVPKAGCSVSLQPHLLSRPNYIEKNLLKEAHFDALPSHSVNVAQDLHQKSIHRISEISVSRKQSVGVPSLEQKVPPVCAENYRAPGYAHHSQQEDELDSVPLANRVLALDYNFSPESRTLPMSKYFNQTFPQCHYQASHHFSEGNDEYHHKNFLPRVRKQSVSRRHHKGISRSLQKESVNNADNSSVLKSPCSKNAENGKLSNFASLTSQVSKIDNGFSPESQSSKSKNINQTFVLEQGCTDDLSTYTDNYIQSTKHGFPKKSRRESVPEKQRVSIPQSIHRGSTEFAENSHTSVYTCKSNSKSGELVCGVPVTCEVSSANDGLSRKTKSKSLSKSKNTNQNSPPKQDPTVRNASETIVIPVIDLVSSDEESEVI